MYLPTLLKINILWKMVFIILHILYLSVKKKKNNQNKFDVT